MKGWKVYLLKKSLEADGGKGGGGGGSETNTNTGGGTNTNTGGGTGTPPALTELLKQGDYQSQFDTLVSKALETAKTKWDTDSTKKIEEAKLEAEKLAKMTTEQRTEAEKKKKEEEFEQRERDLTVRELKAQAHEALAEKGLPKELIDNLTFSDAESCNASIESLDKAFKKAVEAEVVKKLAGTPPKRGNGATTENDESVKFAKGIAKSTQSEAATKAAEHYF